MLFVFYVCILPVFVFFSFLFDWTAKKKCTRWLISNTPGCWLKCPLGVRVSPQRWFLNVIHNLWTCGPSTLSASANAATAEPLAAQTVRTRWGAQRNRGAARTGYTGKKTTLDGQWNSGLVWARTDIADWQVHPLLTWPFVSKPVQPRWRLFYICTLLFAPTSMWRPRVWVCSPLAVCCSLNRGNGF